MAKKLPTITDAEYWAAIDAELERAAAEHKPVTRWTPEMIERLRQWYGRMPAARLAEILGVNMRAAMAKASALGLTRKVGE